MACGGWAWRPTRVRTTRPTVSSATAQVLAQLLEQGQAYHCYCSKEELETMREQQMARKEKPRYDGRCRGRTEPRAGVAPVIRFKNPLDGAGRGGRPGARPGGVR